MGPPLLQFMQSMSSRGSFFDEAVFVYTAVCAIVIYFYRKIRPRSSSGEILLFSAKICVCIDLFATFFCNR